MFLGHYDYAATFQSTLPRGERLRQRVMPISCRNFNPRSREGSDSNANTNVSMMGISIHAPARGATSRYTAQGELFCNFNPRSREGSDPPSLYQFLLHHISIHAPARGATATPLSWACDYKLFQSTLPRGERRGTPFFMISKSTYFNPRSREGSDCRSCYSHNQEIYFNPRSREGSDFTIRMLFSAARISIHAPARGATMISPVWSRSG